MGRNQSTRALPAGGLAAQAQHKNDDSLVLLVRYGQTSALLAGDLEKQMERFVATESPGADLLKVAHHGSATSTTPELLAAVHPRFAVISVGYHNSFGHPRQAVLERLQASQVQTYRTDLFGAVTFLLDGKQVQATCSLADDRVVTLGAISFHSWDQWRDINPTPRMV